MVKCIVFVMIFYFGLNRQRLLLSCSHVNSPNTETLLFRKLLWPLFRVIVLLFSSPDVAPHIFHRHNIPPRPQPPLGQTMEREGLHSAGY
jgi:hypothetical protein